MSQENVEVVLEAVEAFNRGDVDAFVALANPDVNGRMFITARGKGSGVEAPGLRVWAVCWFADEKFIGRQVFRERDDALEAARLSE